MSLTYSKKISLVKGITWRIIGTLDTIFLAWLFTGNISSALKIGGIELITKLILYYLHERLWNFFHIGKKIESEINGVIIYTDKHWKSVAKSISWRVIGTIDTIIISYFVTGSINRAFEIGFTEVFTKMLLYYLHERAWLRIGKRSVENSLRN
ncbi:MAG: DUF2061 domain-containing protein [Bacteroidetes bacterium]|nr:DUF2061 domain-containing protein [Bacteroidota bacterium]